MTDWADEIAKDLYENVMFPEDIAAALRKARADALEEAARAAESLFVHDTLVLGWSFQEAYSAGLNAAATTIRALKDKP
jgi:hypothetical protein